MGDRGRKDKGQREPHKQARMDIKAKRRMKHDKKAHAGQIF